jgi:hypothetical protein
MKDYRYWIQERRESTKQEPNYYSAKYENKEVRVYSTDDCVYVDWYIDGRLIEKPHFPTEIVNEMNLFIQTLQRYIDKHLLYEILNTMKRYLLYLEDEESCLKIGIKWVNTNE